MSVAAHVRVELATLDIDAELEVGDDELCALVGPNGAGKTTLLRALAGLRPIDDGCIRIGDRVVDEPARGVFVAPEDRSVGVVFQDYLLFPHLCVVDNVAFGLRARGSRRADARATASDWLERVGLRERADAQPGQLSGGEAQRVALARALATAPELLLLDEPLSALDARHRAEWRRDLRRLLGDFRGSRVLVTHDAVDALTLADRIVIMHDGRIVQEGAPSEIVARPGSQYVADLIGVNLYRGDAAGGTVTLDSGERIVVAGSHSGATLAVIRPHAVVLHRAQPTGTARNVWRGTIDGVEHLGDRVRVHLTGSLPLVAEVTPSAVASLGLAPGVDVWAAVKATEVEVSPG